MTPNDQERVPPRQHPYATALQMGFDVLHSAPPSLSRLAFLGAIRDADCIRLPALDGNLVVDLAAREVTVANSGPARAVWAVLAVHYLCAAECELDPREVSFGYFNDCRSYLTVFGKRIVGRFLATTGRTGEQFRHTAERIAGTRMPPPGMGYRFDVFPRVPVTIVLHEGDSEIASGASVVYRADVERLLPAEDRVVAAELLLDALAGKTMTGN